MTNLLKIQNIILNYYMFGYSYEDSVFLLGLFKEQKFVNQNNFDVLYNWTNLLYSKTNCFYNGGKK